MNLERFSFQVGISLKNLTYVAYVVPNELKYTQHKIHKFDGEYREISIPNAILKNIQKNISLILESYYKPGGPVHGFVKERSILTNASQHLNSKWVLSLDIKDFFGSINYGRVYGILQKPPFDFDQKLSALVSQLLILDNKLPQGSPASPIISNIICAKMDRDFITFCKNRRLFYTRYADDITFSSQTRRFMLADKSLDFEILNHIKEIVRNNGFEINENKISYSYGKNGALITGLRVTDKVDVPRSNIRRLRSIIDKIRTLGYAGAEEEYISKYKNRNRIYSEESKLINYINGQLSFIHMIRGPFDEVYKNYFEKFKTILPVELKAPSPKSLWDYIYIMESENEAIQGTAFQIADLGIISCAHTYAEDSKVFYRKKFNPKYKLKKIKYDKDIDLAIFKRYRHPIAEGFLRNDKYAYKIGSKLRLLGFPNYRLGDTGIDMPIVITGSRMVSGVERILVNTGIVAGNSGGPILDGNGHVVGVAVTGAENHGELDSTENHSFIPIKYLEKLP
ncbi:reverse transcriptase domain-containing protein [Leptospira sp. SA-E8]|uniref:reverse transcriptase domain-containing protein n=1 Tax=Leptospira sp. SA-E8 TaxID=3422259 RepID=UPI003EB9BFE3